MKVMENNHNFNDLSKAHQQAMQEGSVLCIDGSLMTNVKADSSNLQIWKF